MKRKMYFLTIIVLVLLFVGYKYIYKDHRDIATEKPSISESADRIYESFLTDEVDANSKYLDKTIQVKGVVTAIDVDAQTLVIDSKLNALFTANFPAAVKINDAVEVKGRLVGYDSLLDELQMDQCVIK
jgi:uncharacterized membrane protein